MDTSHEAQEQETEPTRAPHGDGQEYVDRSTLDFNPDDGLYTGTVVDGTTDIPGPHVSPQPGDDTLPEQDDPVQNEQPVAGRDE